MLSNFSSRLTYANVMATIAVFIALGGSSYAALRVTSRNVPKDALTGADIKKLTGKDVTDNSLTGADVKNLTSGDVANGKLLAEDFAPGQLPKGETGAKGETGGVGATGSPAASALVGRGQAPSGASQTRYYSVSALLLNFTGSTTESTDTTVSPNAAISARDLFVKLTVTPGAGASRRFVIRDDGADTTVDCTISHPATTCDSAADQATISPGSEISLKVENSATAPADAQFLYGWRATTP